MSSITTQFEASVREMCIRTWGAARNVKHSAVERVREQRGQTAAEYMGVLVLVAMIIAALVTLKVPQHVADGINNLIDDIYRGEDPKTD